MNTKSLFSKFICFIVTGALLMQGFPLYAQMPSSIDFNSEDMRRTDAQISRAIEKSASQKKFSVKDKAAEIRAVVKEMTSGPLSYEAFVKQYEAEMKAWYTNKLKEELSTADRNWFNKEFEKEMQDSTKKSAYAEYLAEQEKEPTQKQLEEIKKYLKYLSKDLMEIYAVDRKTGQKLIAEALPVFASIGGTDELVKKEASSVLRSLVNANAESCGSIGIWSGLKAKLGKDGDVKQQMNSCEKALSYAMALSVLGEDSKDRSNPDSEALGNLLKQGYRGVMSAQLTSSVGQGLIAMNGERVLTAELINIARQLPDIGLMGSDFSFLSVADWAEAITLIGGDYAKGLEYSFYKNNNEPNMNNVYLDLALYLAEEAAKGNKSAKYVLDRVVLDSVHYDSYGNAGIRFKPFVTGALAGGYQINKPGAVYDQWDSAGRIHKVDTRDAWAKAQEKMQKLNVSQSGYFAVTLFYSGKSDLDPYTELYVNNHLVDAYNKSNSISAFKGMQTQAEPSSKAFQRYSRRQKTIKAGEIVDVALIIFGAAALLKAVVKLGVQGMRSGVRMLKLARAGNGANGLGFSKNLARVNKMAKAQKGLSVVSVKQSKMTKALRNRSIKKEPVKKPVAPNTVQNPTAGASAESRAVNAARVEGASPAASAPIAPVKELNPAVSAVREEAVAGKLIGPLESKVAAAPQFKPISERGILPKPKKGTKPSGLRSDNLVYAEAHGSDPSKVILYHADDYGYAVRTSEIPRAQYDDMIAVMSEADKAGLQKTGELFAPEIKSARLELDYSHLDDLAKEVRALRAQRAALASGEFSKEGLISARNIDKRIAALEKQAGRMIDDIAKEGGFSRESVSFIYNDAAQYIPETVKAAKPQNLTMGSRSLMPSVSKNVKPGAPRADGLVYMEAHPTDPSKAVFYYADDAGREITAKEVLMSDYETFSASLSNSDKARIVSDARYMEADIRVARINREYDRLDNVAKRVRDLRAQRANIAAGNFSQDNIITVRRIDKELASLESQANGIIDDIVKESGYSRSSVSFIYDDAAQYIPETVNTVKPQNLLMKDRNLMPSVSKNVKPGAPRADGLVYVEAHPTNPKWVVAYYADDTGKVVKAKELWHTEYNSLTASMSEADKARLLQDSKAFSAEIKSARLNREYDRLDDIAEKVKNLRIKRTRVTSPEPSIYSTGKIGKKEIAEVNRIDKEIAALEREAKGVIRDISREQGVSRNAISQIYEDAALYIPEKPAPITRQSLTMNERSLMPKVSENIRPAAQRADGLVYMEAHPTDANKAIFYYADDMGSAVTPREVWRTEYNKVLSSMTESEQAGLLRDSRNMASEIKSARIELEYSRMEKIGDELEQIAKRFETIKKPGYEVEWAHAEAPKLTRRRNQLAEELKKIFKDISREQGVKESSVRQTFFNSYPEAA